MKEKTLNEKRKELRELVRDKIFKWGIQEGGDKLHFNELVDEIFYYFEQQDKQFIKELKEFIEDKTYKRETGEIIRFMPFEFEEFLKEKAGDLK